MLLHIIIVVCVPLQLRDLLERTLDAYVTLFDLDDKTKLPILKMELTFDDEKMQFYPPSQDLEDTVLFVVKTVRTCSVIHRPCQRF